MSYVWETHLGGETPLDAEYHLNARVEIASFLNEPPGVVLDIGCGGGATGKLIKEKFPGTPVIGIEINAHAAEHARGLLDTVICASIDAVNLVDHLGGLRVDTVLLLDVLEHLYDPWRSLRRIRGWLEPGTRVIASLPNIRNILTLDHLAGGRWDYDKNGVLDITHVRFFTKSTLRQLFEQTGYQVRRLEPLLQPEMIDRVVVQRGPGRIDTRNLRIKFRSTDELEDLYALQHVVDAITVADAK
ncbi:MAG TPA: class I SAM-dependent methyltransferase [Casimicrobiaceae bacterium]|jgi:2-polyprenyl-3-methyl-5-hydroxy-6-metoxy-1,4-benzoquinol methylase|nr:class I SAM-dependent methyltransferase [Casimicrobiaceae bacterium]